jgi:hypothetical protein
MANTDNPNGFRFAFSTDGHAPMMLKAVLKSAVALVPGDAVELTTAGLLVCATATSSNIFGICQQKVTSSATTRQNILVIPAADNYVWEGQCSGTFAQSQLGLGVDIEGSTGIMEIDENATSTKMAMIVGLAKNQAGDNALGANARVYFTWIKTSWNKQA